MRRSRRIYQRIEILHCVQDDTHREPAPIHVHHRTIQALRKQLASTRGGLAVPTALETTKIIPGSLPPTLQRNLRAESSAFLRADRADVAECHRLQSFLSVIFHYQSRVENLLKILADHNDAMSA